MHEENDFSVIISTACLYEKLGVGKCAQQKEIRQAYLRQSKKYHPDRSNDPMAKEACTYLSISSFYTHFLVQALSTAYKTLSTPSSRRAYDVYGAHVDGSSRETFSNVVSQVFNEFLAGEYDTLLRLIAYLNSIRPDLGMDQDIARQIFASIRDFCLKSRRYWEELEIIKLYEIQQDLHTSSYFDITGRLKLSLSLSRNFLQISFSLIEASNNSSKMLSLKMILFKMIQILDCTELKIQSLENRVSFKLPFT